MARGVTVLQHTSGRVGREFTMKTLCTAMLIAVAAATAPALAATITEDQVLHATFAAFQQPGVLSKEHIHNSRKLLVTAARQGNETALLVLSRQDQPGRFTVGSAADSAVEERVAQRR